jgi:two-component system nitrogen regulation response regulator NtrX
MASLDVLIIDDELEIRSLISDILKDEGYSPRVAVNDKTALAALQQKIPHLVILDVWLEGSEIDGLGVLELIKKRYPLLPVIIISGHATVEAAIRAIKLGAYDYIEKPFSYDRLLITIKRACEAAKLRKENIELKNKIVDKVELIGVSQYIVKLKLELEKISLSNSRVMVYGPIGSGKELISRLIHKKSKKCNGHFVYFSPTGLSNEKIEQELFGEYDKKSHNAHLNKKNSLLESAHGGTLYIDEITDLPLNSQTKLLKFLQDLVIEKPESPPIKVDLRLIVTTTKNIQHIISQGKFREDLFYRLNVVPLKMIPLSDRKEDIPALIDYFVNQIVKSSGVKKRSFSKDAVVALQEYSWPGNVRQLKNVIEWTLIMAPIKNAASDEIKVDALPIDVISNGPPIQGANNTAFDIDVMSMTLRDAREVFEKQYILAQLTRFYNNISKTASFIGMERSALHRKVRGLHIHPDYEADGEVD